MQLVSRVYHVVQHKKKSSVRVKVEQKEKMCEEGRGGGVSE